MNTPTRILLEQIGLLGYRVAIAISYLDAIALQVNEPIEHRKP